MGKVKFNNAIMKCKTFFILDRRYGCFTGYRIVAAPAVTASVMTAPPNEVEVITAMTGMDMACAGTVSHNGKVTSRANQAIITGGYDDDGHDGVGHGWDGYSRSVTDLKCLQTFSKFLLMPYDILLFDTFKFTCKTKIGINEMKTSEHDVSN